MLWRDVLHNIMCITYAWCYEEHLSFEASLIGSMPLAHKNKLNNSIIITIMVSSAIIACKWVSYVSISQANSRPLCIDRAMYISNGLPVSLPSRKWISRVSLVLFLPSSAYFTPWIRCDCLRGMPVWDSPPIAGNQSCDFWVNQTTVLNDDWPQSVH